MPGTPPAGPISIHAPREGSDTRPPYPCGASHISIHAPREGSDLAIGQDDHPGLISIHAPREGSDPPAMPPTTWTTEFLSTLPARGATGSELLSALGGMISIHAPREGSDRRGPLSGREKCRFLSTLPARGATNDYTSSTCFHIFLSTLPARGATHRRPGSGRTGAISIHAPREGSD